MNENKTDSIPLLIRMDMLTFKEARLKRDDVYARAYAPSQAFNDGIETSNDLSVPIFWLDALRGEYAHTYISLTVIQGYNVHTYMVSILERRKFLFSNQINIYMKSLLLRAVRVSAGTTHTLSVLDPQNELKYLYRKESLDFWLGLLAINCKSKQMRGRQGAHQVTTTNQVKVWVFSSFGSQRASETPTR